MTFKPSIAIAAVIAAAILLSGCTDGGADDGASKPTPSASSSVAVAYEVGAVVDPDAVLADGQKAYALPDGTFVVVDKDLPLPEAVQSDLTAKGEAVVAAHPDGTVNTNEATQAMGKYTIDITRSTGKRAVIVWYRYGFPTVDDAEKVYFYSISGGPGTGSDFYTDRSEVESIVNGFMADPTNASSYVLVWTD